MSIHVSTSGTHAASTSIDSLSAVCSALGATPEQLRVLADTLEHGEPTLREAYERIHHRIPNWLETQLVPRRRLLDGERPTVGPGGATLPGIDALGDLSVRVLNERGAAHVRQVQARVSAQRRDNTLAHDRLLRASDPRDMGHGAAQHSVDLIRRVGAEIERVLHIEMPIRDLRVAFRKGDVHAFSETEMQSWPVQLLRRQDPVLDVLVAETGLETGARRSALTGLRLLDCDPTSCRIWFPSKGYRKQRYWVPVHRSLILRILALALERGARSGNDPVFLRLPGPDGHIRPITRRYWDCLFAILDSGFPESPHTHRLRHTANERVYRACGSETAIRCLDHEPSGGLRTNYRYVAGGEMPEDQFLEKMVAAFGPYDDCDLPPNWRALPYADGGPG